MQVASLKVTGESGASTRGAGRFPDLERLHERVARPAAICRVQAILCGESARLDA